MNKAILQVVGIGLRFGGVRALSGVSFSVRAGEVCAVIGPNGAGKSSLLNCINCVYSPTEGKILFDGVNLIGMRPYEVAERGIARTFQNLTLFHGMSTLDNIMTGRNLALRSPLLLQGLGFGPAWRTELKNREAVEQIIDFLELEAYRKSHVSELPYGIQKRIDLGRALALEPRMLLLDEPMAGMNLEEKQDMSRYILEVNRELSTTIVLIEHDMGVVMDISDHVVVLDYGVKIGDGAPDEVQRNPDIIAAYLGTEG